MSIPCGSAIRHPLGSSGSLGCLVKRNGQTCILSNNHVLALVNQASIGDFTEDSSSGSPIATLSKIVQLNIGGGTNSVDAAISAVSIPGSVTPNIQGIDRFSSTPMNAFIGQKVIMSGAASGLMTGTVTGINSSVTLIFNDNTAIEFVNQIQIQGDTGSFCTDGDSGSLILDQASMRPVGLLVGEDGFAYANHISAVLSTLGVTIIPG